MEKLYKKVNGKYVQCGYTDVPDLYDGIWLVTDRNNVKSTSSLLWKIGDIPMADLNLFVSILKYENDLSTYLLRLTQGDSEECKEILEDFNFKEPLGIYNWPIAVLTSVLLKKIGELIQNEKNDFIFTKSATLNNRKEKLIHLTRLSLIQTILRKIENTPEEELIEKLKNLNQETLEDFLLTL